MSIGCGKRFSHKWNPIQSIKYWYNVWIINKDNRRCQRKTTFGEGTQSGRLVVDRVLPSNGTQCNNVVQFCINPVSCCFNNNWNDMKPRVTISHSHRIEKVHTESSQSRVVRSGYGVTPWLEPQHDDRVFSGSVMFFLGSMGKKLLVVVFLASSSHIIIMLFPIVAPAAVCSSSSRGHLLLLLTKVSTIKIPSEVINCTLNHE